MRLELRYRSDVDLSQPAMQVEIRSHIARCLRDNSHGGEGVITLAGIEHCFMYVVQDDVVHTVVGPPDYIERVLADIGETRGKRDPRCRARSTTSPVRGLRNSAGTSLSTTARLPRCRRAARREHFSTGRLSMPVARRAPFVSHASRVAGAVAVAAVITRARAASSNASGCVVPRHRMVSISAPVVKPLTQKNALHGFQAGFCRRRHHPRRPPLVAQTERRDC